MRTLLIVATTLAVLGLVAAPTVSADPTPEPPPGFGRCVITEQTVGEVPIVGPIVVPDVECYW